MTGQVTWLECWMAHFAIECTRQLDVPVMRAEAQLKKGA